MSQNISSSEHQSKLIKSAFYMALFVASVNLIIKSYGWIVTGSSSMLASLVDSLLDATTSGLSLIAVHFAFMPPDDNHRFGHHKIQDLALFGQALFLIGSGIIAIGGAIYKFTTHGQVAEAQQGVVIILISILMTFALLAYQKFVLTRTNSQLVKADKLHYFTDTLSNALVIASIYASQYYWFLDPIFGVLIAGYIVYSAAELFKNAVKNLLDEEMGQKERKKITEVLARYKEVHAVHELKTRRAGDKVFIQFHLEMSGEMLLKEAHNISEKIMCELVELFPNAEIIIHQDPIGEEEGEYYREEL